MDSGKPRQKRRVDFNNPAAGAMRAGHLHVMNKSAASVQLSAEQLLAESFDIARHEKNTVRPDLVITTKAELLAHRQAKRKEFEEKIQRDRSRLDVWLKFAAWEAHQPCVPQARIVFERAADIHSTNPALWRAYLAFEMKHGGAERTRAVANRAVSTIPAEEELWLQYAYIEEVIGDWCACRNVFERWLRFDPPPPAYRAFCRFEIYGPRTDSIDVRRQRARVVLGRFAAAHNAEATWLFYAECEATGLEDKPRAVEVLRSAFIALPNSEYQCPRLSQMLAEVLEELDVIDDARATYRRALAACDGKPLTAAHHALVARYTRFEMVNGNNEQLESQVFAVRRVHYRSALQTQPSDVASWFSLIAIEKVCSTPTAEVVALYDKAAFDAIPDSDDKFHWRPLAMLWLSYALYVEQDGRDPEAAAKVLQRALQCINERSFTFSKLWIALSDLYVRCGDTDGAIDILATALKHHPTQKLFRRIIDVHTRLKRFSQAREHFEAYVTHFGERAAPWIAFAKFEEAQGDAQAANAVYDRALSHASLKDKDMVWIESVGSRLNRKDVDGARAAYLRLLNVTVDACVTTASKAEASEAEIVDAVSATKKVLHMLVKFELTLGQREHDAAVAAVREQWKDACARVRRASVKASASLFADWKEFELRHGNNATQKEVETLLSRPEAKRNRLMAAAAGF